MTTTRYYCPLTGECRDLQVTGARAEHYLWQPCRWNVQPSKRNRELDFDFPYERLWVREDTEGYLNESRSPFPVM